MRADGGDHDGGHAGVDHAGAGRHRVRRAARGGGHDQSVSLCTIRSALFLIYTREKAFTCTDVINFPSRYKSMLER